MSDKKKKSEDTSKFTWTDRDIIFEGEQLPPRLPSPSEGKRPAQPANPNKPNPFEHLKPKE